ncbi:SDR family oxidoreductase [Nocardia sp. NPDC057353]|uniref:SDR family oxidoreductase n=1 Tax=Nocardia sp. NPDC057353 TaxID=3346104 RepID=UPI003645A950
MVSYIVTGGSEFLRGRVVRQLLDADRDAVVHVPTDRTGATLLTLPAGVRVPQRDVPAIDHIVHLGPASPTAEQANHMTELRWTLGSAARLGATLNYLSSVAVAGAHPGRFFEDDFDLGQPLTCAAHRLAFAAEGLVRHARDVRWRIFRSGILSGDSRTGEVDHGGGTAPFLAAIARLTGLPTELPVILPDWGTTNVVPVDYVASALAELVRRPGQHSRTFHLVNPARQGFADLYAALARAAGAPRGIALPGSGILFDQLARVPGYPLLRDHVMDLLGIPAHAPAQLRVPAEFIDDTTRARLRHTGIAVPGFDSYADRLWTRWQREAEAEAAPLALRTVHRGAAVAPRRELAEV